MMTMGAIEGHLPLSLWPDGRRAAEPSPLLDPEQLLVAIAGRLKHDSPLISWARELGDLHAGLVSGRISQSRFPLNRDESAVRHEVEHVITEIDTWAALHIPRSPRVRMHTHSLGEVISHAAQTYASAWWTVLHTDDLDRRHEAWFHLGQVREGYADLIGEIRAHRIQLPRGGLLTRCSDGEYCRHSPDTNQISSRSDGFLLLLHRLGL